MLELEQDEREAVRQALEQRKRASGVGTPDYDHCKRVLDKLSRAGFIERPKHRDAREAVSKA